MMNPSPSPFTNVFAATTAVAAMAMATIAAPPSLHAAMTIDKQPFGKTAAGEAVELFKLSNGKGMTVGITNYGGIVTSIEVPDRDGKPGDVALGLDTLADYEARSPYFGCITGRYANRIAGGKFELDGTTHELAVNNGPNALHGGLKGFDKVVWDAKTRKSEDGVSLILTRTSPDGEEGYPGNLETTVTYTVTDANELRIDYRATTDKPTVVNLTNHTYFNLEGHGAGSILDHVLTIRAAKFTPTDDTGIPTGELRPVAGTPLDFTKAKPIRRDIGADDEQISFGKGFDHNYVLDGEAGKLRTVARISAPESGRIMEVATTEPGMQLYTANFMSKMDGKDGATYDFRGAFCLETQHFPDSPNQPSFPSTRLDPGKVYETTTVYRFLIE